jgi:hypothetical protein
MMMYCKLDRDLQDGPESWDPNAVQKAVLDQLGASPVEMVFVLQ